MRIFVTAGSAASLSAPAENEAAPSSVAHASSNQRRFMSELFQSCQCMRLMQRRDLARGRVEVGAHAAEHVVDGRRGAVGVVVEVISGYVRGDLAKDPRPSGKERHEL